MFRYKTRDQNSKFMPLNGTEKDLKEAWYSYWKKGTASAAHDFMSVVDPYLRSWEEQLLTECPPTFQYQTLHMMLEHRGDPLVMLRVWTEYSERYSSVYEELQLLMLYVAKRLKRFPENGAPKQTCFVLAQYFKSYLSREITKRNTRFVDTTNEVDIDDVCRVMPVYKNYMSSHPIHQEAFAIYLLHLRVEAQTVKEFKALTNYTNDEYKRTKEVLWKRLSTITVMIPP